MPNKKRKLVANPYPVMLEAVESGACYAIGRRLFKHISPPKGWDEETEDRAIKEVVNAVMSNICEAFDL